MKKRAFIIHGWEGYPEEGWFPWLKQELETRDFEVYVPAMPDTKEPKIEVWVPYLAQLVGKPNENTYFVGHSMGCQTILRYLETLETGEKVGGAVFVAGWFTLTPEAAPSVEEQAIIRPWLETPVDFVRVKQTTNNFVAIVSDDDEYVPPENQVMYKEKLGAKIIVEHKRGHFSGDTGIKELPLVLETILEMAR